MSSKQPIVLSETGTPFVTKAEAIEYVKAKSLDPKLYPVREYQGGFALVDVAGAIDFATEQMSGGQTSEAKKEGADETYTEVVFTAPQANDSPFVPLVRNGWDLRVQRGKPVVLPESFLKIAEQAVMTSWVTDTKDRNNPIKAGQPIARYPFTRIKPSSRAAFMEMLTSGNTVQNAFIQNLRKAAP